MSEQKIRHVGDYRKLRKSAYPPIEEFVDAYYHESRGNPKPMKEYLAKIDAVKAKIPKLDKTKEG